MLEVDKDLAKLIEIALQEPDTLTPSQDIGFDLTDIHRAVKRFILELKIIPGSTKVPNFLIYYYYMTNKTSPNKLSKQEFFRNFNKIFKSIRTSKTRYYLVNDGIFDISKDMVVKTKKYDLWLQRLRKTKVSKRHDKKKQNQISESQQPLQLKE